MAQPREARPNKVAHCFALIVLALATIGAHPVHAQVSGSVSIASDDRLRGRTLSSDRPVASLALAYDDASGFYFDATATASATRADGIALIGGTVDAGYAWRAARSLGVDIGVLRQQFTRHFSGGRVTGYTEFYTGVSLGNSSVRVSYSPDYFSRNSRSLYLSIDRTIRLSDAWRVSAHAGTIAYLSPLRVRGLRTIEYDYGVAIARRWGLFEGRLSLTSGGPDVDFYAGRPHAKTRLAISSSFVF